MGFPLFLRYLFFRSFPHIFERFVSILMVFYLFVKYLLYCRSTHVRFVPIFRSFVCIFEGFVPILSLLLLIYTRRMSKLGTES